MTARIDDLCARQDEVDQAGVREIVRQLVDEERRIGAAIDSGYLLLARTCEPPSSRTRLGMSASSIVPSTCGWLDRICSSSVEPERGRPTMKIGSGALAPCPARAAKNCGVNSACMRRICSEFQSAS